jgi:hypothetical protein
LDFTPQGPLVLVETSSIPSEFPKAEELPLVSIRRASRKIPEKEPEDGPAMDNRSIKAIRVVGAQRKISRIVIVDHIRQLHSEWYQSSTFFYISDYSIDSKRQLIWLATLEEYPPCLE